MLWTAFQFLHPPLPPFLFPSGHLLLEFLSLFLICPLSCLFNYLSYLVFSRLLSSLLITNHSCLLFSSSLHPPLPCFSPPFPEPFLFCSHFPSSFPFFQPASSGPRRPARGRRDRSGPVSALVWKGFSWFLKHFLAQNHLLFLFNLRFKDGNRFIHPFRKVGPMILRVLVPVRPLEHIVLPGANGELSALEDDQFIRVEPPHFIRCHQFAMGVSAVSTNAFGFSTLVLRLVFNQDCGLTQQFAEI